jgi:hypothetical protein
MVKHHHENNQTLSIFCKHSHQSRRSVVSSTNKNDLHDITGILLKAALSTINQTNQTISMIATCSKEINCVQPTLIGQMCQATEDQCVLRRN